MYVMAAFHSSVDSTVLSRAFISRDIIVDQNLRRLYRMRRLGHSSDDSVSTGDHKLGQFKAAHVEGLQPSQDAAEGAQWRNTCSAISSQWAVRAEESKPVISVEKESWDLQIVRGPENGIARSSFIPPYFENLPKPLSMADLAIPPTHGSSIRVAYQGAPGAYSEDAALKAYPNCEAVPCEQFEAAFQAVELFLVDRAVLPIENSLGGSIHRNYDLLLRHRLHIVGEVQVAIHHCLLGLPGVRKEELERVLSQPQALSQCESTLTKLGVIREEVDDSAGAAQASSKLCLICCSMKTKRDISFVVKFWLTDLSVDRQNQNSVLLNMTSTHVSPAFVDLKLQFIAQCNLRNTGAVASARAAEIYGMEILLEGIQDDPDNVTRFLMLAREPIIPRTDRPFRTSIVVTLAEGPGVLFKALGVFSLRNISLTKIESRPQRKKPLHVVDDISYGVAKYFDYLFYIDFDTSMADPRAQNALRHLQEFASFLRVLGSYPVDVAYLGSSASI